MFYIFSFFFFLREKEIVWVAKTILKLKCLDIYAYTQIISHLYELCICMLIFPHHFNTNVTLLSSEQPLVVATRLNTHQNYAWPKPSQGKVLHQNPRDTWRSELVWIFLLASWSFWIVPMLCGGLFHKTQLNFCKSKRRATKCTGRKDLRENYSVLTWSQNGWNKMFSESNWEQCLWNRLRNNLPCVLVLRAITINHLNRHTLR